MRLGLIACWLGVLNNAAASASSAEAPASPRLRIVTSILPVYCFTHQVAGGNAQLDNLLAAGADAHDFQLSRRERQLIDTSDLLVINGLGMEQWLQKALSQARPRLVTIEAARGLGGSLSGNDSEGTPTGASGHAGGTPNPHVWLDPLLAKQMVTNILDALEKADPGRRAAYASNALSYIQRLEQLHQEIAAGLAPFRHAPIVTYHNAFEHFARRYQLKVVGVIEEVPDVEPTFSHLAALAKTIREQRVKVIFTEPHHDGRLAHTLGRDLGVRVALMDTLESGPLRAEAYEDQMRANLRILQENLK
ncbi:MAG TPA: zinc ABC transporter substrate-binding protein [Verrucomicrobiae bacterium]|nr:zinc ABC transporter substrate-binding protein [Verrucomicrobiae bacterium]